jgi:hypothetical protein
MFRVSFQNPSRSTLLIRQEPLRNPVATGLWPVLFVFIRVDSSNSRAKIEKRMRSFDPRITPMDSNGNSEPTNPFESE